MTAAGYALKNRAVMFVLVLTIIAAGMFAYGQLGRLEDPEFTIKEAVVSTQYPGATAEQVELEVTEVLETAVQQLKQLKEVRSISRAGLSILFVEIQDHFDKHDLPQVWDELRRKVSEAAGSLPPGSATPVVNDDFGDVYGVLFALTGDGYTQHDLKEVATDLRRELLLCTDVGRVDFWGLPTEVVYVEIDRARLVRLGIAPSEIFATIEGQNSVAEAGKVAVGPGDVRFRISGDFADVDGLAEQLIPGGENRRMIRLKDVATIRRAPLDPPDAVMRWNGRPAVGLGISTVAGGDVVAMGASIKKRLAELEKRLPFGIELHAIAHQSETVKEAVRGFEYNLLSAVVIVLLLLVLFMGLREGLVIGLVLLLTILATFVCMYAMDISLQRISLGALIIALGMLVDNAIVVAEGISVKSAYGMDPAQAAEETVRETQWPLLGATGIAILAFAAITLSKDMTGEWLKSLFQVIWLSLGLSWLFAITITPYLCVAMPGRRKSGGEPPRPGRLMRGYGWFVKLCVGHRFLSIATLLLLLFTSFWGFGFVKQDFMPDMNRPQITLDVWMPEGTRIARTAHEVEQIDAYVRGLAHVTDVAGFVGRGPLRFLLTYEPEMSNSAYGQLLISLDTDEVIPELKRRIAAYLLEHHPMAITSVDAFKLGPGGGSVVARLSGPDGQVLRDLAEEVKGVMRANPNARSIRTDWDWPVLTQTIAMAGARAQETGVTREVLAQSLAMNFSGSQAGTYRHEDDLLPLYLRPPREQRTGIENLTNTHIWSTSQQHWVPIGQVIDGQETRWETPVIHRLNRIRVLRVICKQISGTTDALFRELKQPLEALSLPEGYTLEWGGEHEEQVEANTKLMSNVPIAFVAMFFISVMLFNTLRHPLIIFLGLPMTIIGVTCGMLLADKPFGFMAMLGFLSLSGMLIKNEIVLLDQINLEKAAGKTPYEAVIASALGRARPVVMAAFTTVLGMAPLLWDAFFAPMAVTIMGGLTFATVLTLVITPVLYCTFFRVRPPKRVAG